MTRIQDEIGPIRALARAPFETPPFGEFLAKLRERVRGGVILAIQGSGAVWRAWPDRPSAGAAERFVRAELPRRDRFPRQRLRDGRVYSLDELLDPVDPADRAWREALAAARLRVVRGGTPEGGAFLLALVRTGRDFAAVDAALLSDLAPLVAEAADALLRVEAERRRGAAGALALARLGLDWTILDREGQAVAGAPLPALRGLREAMARGAAMLLEALPDRSPVLLVPRPAEGGAVAFREAAARGATDPAALGRWFGLAPAEARFAALLGDGLSIVEAGARLGLTAQTARHYSKRIYQKTGARGQAAVVARLRSGVFALLRGPA